MTAFAGRAPNIPTPGFTDPTRESQAAFRAILDALAHPTRRYPLAGPAQPPAALGRGLGAVALTLLDEDISVWLAGGLGADAELAAWLDFHTAATRTGDPASADFAFATPATLPTLDTFRLGTDETPHVSTTIVLDVRRPAPAEHAAHAAPTSTTFTATGPGINVEAQLDAPWADAIPDFLAQWQANARLFPRGVDLLLVDDDTVSALPRTTRLSPRAADAGQEG